MPETILVDAGGGVAQITLNRPEARNAMSDLMVQELYEAFQSIQDEQDIRVVVLKASGRVFCAGGDIKDLKAAETLSEEAKVARMRYFDHMLATINTAPQVTIACIQGMALGGGLGLVCVSDIALAGESAQFGLPEVRLGLAPALISPYLIECIGFSRVRQLALTGVRFSAADALRYGLVHHTCPDEDLDGELQACVEQALHGGPRALAETKKLLFYIRSRSIEDSVDYRAALINRLRNSSEGQEGILAFIEKRQPSWNVSERP